MLSQIRAELHNLGAILFCKYLSAEVKNLSEGAWIICFSFQQGVNIAGRDVSSEPGLCVSVRQELLLMKLHLPGCFGAI